MSVTRQEKEVAALNTLRALVSDVLQEKHDDVFLLRWLRARNNDPVKAEQMLRASLVWRRQRNLDDNSNQYVPPKLLQRYLPLGQCGTDKDGCPVWILPFGYYDIRGLLQSAKKADLIMHVVHVVEGVMMRMEQQTIKLGQPITQHYLIIDLEQFGILHFMWKPAFNLMRTLVNLYDNNYPELLKRAMLINAPKIFHVAFALLKPFIHENTQKKIVLYGKDGWKDVVFNDMERSELPERWGGTLKYESEDDNWWTTLSLSKEVPSSYYMDPAKRLGEEKDTRTITVNKSDSFCICIEVKEIGTVLKWLFHTEDSDIGFGIYLKTDNGKEEIISNERLDTHLVPEEGTYICTHTGTYEFVFDNSFSYFRSKKVVYKLQKVAPNEIQTNDYTS